MYQSIVFSPRLLFFNMGGGTCDTKRFLTDGNLLMISPCHSSQSSALIIIYNVPLFLKQ